MELLNDGKERINKETFNSKMIDRIEESKEKDDAKTVEVVRNMVAKFF